MISALGAAREKDGGSLRALCQAVPASNEGKEAKKVRAWTAFSGFWQVTGVRVGVDDKLSVP